MRSAPPSRHRPIIRRRLYPPCCSPDGSCYYVSPFTDIQILPNGASLNLELGLYAGFDAPVADAACASGLTYISQSYRGGAVEVRRQSSFRGACAPPTSRVVPRSSVPSIDRDPPAACSSCLLATQAACTSTPGGQYWATLNMTCGMHNLNALLLPSFHQVREVRSPAAASRLPRVVDCVFVPRLLPASRSPSRSRRRATST
jgi:hypothetical protein